jgi:multidrug efflux pump subunit AcrB
MQKLLEYFLNNRLLINIMVIMVAIFGTYSFLHIQQDVMPAVDLNMMFINVVYPGASPSDIEMNAVVPV